MPEVRSLVLSSLLSSRSIPFEGAHPSGRSRPPPQVKANSGRLQPGMGGRLKTESVVAFERNGWSPWTGIRTRNTIWGLERAGAFPRRRQITANKVAWLESEVDAWIASRPTAQEARDDRR